MRSVSAGMAILLWVLTAVPALAEGTPAMADVSLPSGVDLAAPRTRTYLFQPEDRLMGSGRLALIGDLSFGRRIGRPATVDGAAVRQMVGLEAGLTRWLELGAEVGLVADVAGAEGVTPGTYVEAGARLGAAILDQRRGHPLNLVARVGGLREGDGVPVLTGALVVGRDFKGFDLLGSATLEVPLSRGRDQVDVLFAVGGSWFATPDLRIGAEATAADLEALWEPEESEGGARLVAGPTVAVDLRRDTLVLGGSVMAGVVAVPRPTLTGSPPDRAPTVTARASLAWTFF